MITLPILLAGALTATQAADQANINSQIFRPSIGSQEFFGVIDTDLPSKTLTFDGLLQFVKSPLQFTSPTGETSDVVGNVLQLDLTGAYRMGSIRVGFDLPLLLRSFGGVSEDSSGVGDLVLDGKWLAVDPATAPLGVAFVGRAILPTSSAGAGLSVADLGGEAAVAVTKRLVGGTHLSLDVGTNFQPSVELENTTWGSQLFVDAGVAVPMGLRWGLVGEAHSTFVYESFDAASTPVELVAGGWYRVGDALAWKVRPGVGWGVTDGIGAPAVRGLLALAYDPIASEPRDSDGDGLIDSADGCASVPEDRDGYEDGDGCAEPTRVTVLVKDSDGFPVEGLEWTSSVGPKGKAGGSAEFPAGDATFQAADVSLRQQVPEGAPTTVTLVVPAPRGTLEVLVRDPSGKAIAGATWTAKGGSLDAKGEAGARIPVRPGSYDLTASAAGYRSAKGTVTVAKDGSATLTLDMLPSKADLSGSRIDIKDSVYFETSKAIIKPESFGLLDEVAEILANHPELTRVRIEGHTDDRGGADDNQTLSQARAESVRAYLIGKGIAESRLEAAGFGESRPLVKGRGEPVWSKNRRVDFFIVERSDGTN